MKLESTPVTELTIKPHGNSKDKAVYTLKLYWSQNKGIYGHQIRYQIFKNYSLVNEGLTNGCGYCKESHAFGEFIKYISKGKVYINDGKVSWYLHKYNIGGNYYECTKTQLMDAST